MNLSEEQIPPLSDELPVEYLQSEKSDLQNSEEESIAENPVEHHAENPAENLSGEKSYKQVFDAFLADLDSLPDAEAKLQKAITFMEEALSQGGTPHFKSFWEARNICIELFKQNINPTSRTLFWAKYSDLSKEARRLKEILEEQSAFAAEQIEIAIDALEKEIERRSETLSSGPGFEFAILAQSLRQRAESYAFIQSELSMLNAQAARINALRKELIKTEMRIKQKNKFFQRLSQAGDKVFPRRKELIKEISQQFIGDIDAFIADYFTEKEIDDSLFFLREEIKALQGMAKLLTLNTHAFTHTRMCLSQCWDSIKEVEKERKKERSQQKLIFRQNYDQFHSEIEAFRRSFEEGQLSLGEAQKRLDDLAESMRQMELGRDELRAMREELNQARQPLLDKLKEIEQEKQQQVQDRENLRKKSIQELYQQGEFLLNQGSTLDVEALIAKREELLVKIAESSLSKIERQELERRLKPLRDLIAEKKEQALLALSDDDRQLLQQLKELLREKRDLRQEIKGQIEVFRKATHGSGLDFEQSMNYNAQIATEKERLEKINLSIREIENKIDEIEDRG